MRLKNKRVLITGAGGFIGSHLVERLVIENCKVRALVRYNSLNRRGWLDTFPKTKLGKIDIFIGDMRDPRGVKEAMKDINIVFHLAALTGIPYSYLSPESYVDTNIRGTLNVLSAAREEKVEKIMITSTSEVYGTAEYVPIDEFHRKKGQSPYSATKIGADSMATAFGTSFDLPVVIVRPFNTYGPRQSARAIIPTIIIQLLSGKIGIEVGSLYPTRDLVFVKDIIDGFLEIAKSDKTIGEEINIATQDEISMRQLVQKLIQMINPKAKIIIDKKRVRPDKSEVKRLLGSNEKLRRLTNWKPRYSLDNGLRETINWFKNKNNLAFYKPDIYNV